MSYHDTMEQFTPGPETGKALRGALSRFGTGVTIVTTMTEDGPVGIAANSFSSVSLDPALVLWSVGKASRRYPYFSGAKHMAIHVLGADQLDLCKAFAASPHAFEGVIWEEGAYGLPLLSGCLARFECERYAEYDGGDHGILVGLVQKVAFREGAPLMCFGSQFGQFRLEG